MVVSFEHVSKVQSNLIVPKKPEKISLGCHEVPVLREIFLTSFSVGLQGLLIRFFLFLFVLNRF